LGLANHIELCILACHSSTSQLSLFTSYHLSAEQICFLQFLAVGLHAYMNLSMSGLYLTAGDTAFQTSTSLLFSSFFLPFFSFLSFFFVPEIYIDFYFNESLLAKTSRSYKSCKQTSSNNKEKSKTKANKSNSSLPPMPKKASIHNPKVYMGHENTFGKPEEVAYFEQID
jgi:hypothetical protein